MLLSPAQYVVFESEFKHSASALSDPQHTANELYGAGQYADITAQATLTPVHFSRTATCVQRAFRKVPVSGQPLNSFVNIKQQHSEPYHQFIDRLKESVTRQIDNTTAQNELMKKLAFENANTDCKKALQSIIHRPKYDLADMIQACADVGSQSHAMSLLAGAFQATNIPTGPLPPKVAGLILPKFSAAKEGIQVIPGVLDPDYVGTIMVQLWSHMPMQLKRLLAVVQRIGEKKLLQIYYNNYKLPFNLMSKLALPLSWKSTSPVWVEQWPITGEKLLALKQLVNEQLSADHIEPSVSPYNTPIFVIKKKSGKWRFLQDLRKINQILEPMGPLQCGLPNPNMIPHSYQLAIIDLQDCFVSIPLQEKDRKFFAFTVPVLNNSQPTERYQWKVLPQGMLNSPTMCQQYISHGTLCCLSRLSIILPKKHHLSRPRYRRNIELTNDCDAFVSLLSRSEYISLAVSLLGVPGLAVRYRMNINSLAKALNFTSQALHLLNKEQSELYNGLL
ncbi:endogenous retrovirus group K member 11 Pol protein-like [Podarcis lilfordi]|uniref:ribonuclease H n=1 Tax=Podarcis lilfordi TaxID=74358 RepID=A0AA35LGC5_9SAUR|nr:endogenous retrovirus group K member 11 Pol protein-like [Podarcis lilfordi]